MKFVDRTKELARVRRLLDSESPKFIVIYGRRRVGKSTLIKKAFENHKAIYFQADETQHTNQLSLLAKSIATLLEGFDRVIYPDWTALLEALNHRIEPGTVLCLDEFPYLVKSFPALPSVIQNFWDNGSPRFSLIICGSSQQAMHSDFLNESSPLYGRADLIMKLQPISISYIMGAMHLTDASQAVEYYSCWGGIPRYWQLCMQFGDFDDSFRELLLTPESMLIDEPNRLLRDDMRDLMLSSSILSVIGDGANRLSEIAARIGKNATELTAPIKKLIDMGYVTKDVPFGESPKKSKKTLYKISDPFLAAFYRFAAPNRSLISMGRADFVWKKIESDLKIFFGNGWESICRAAVSGNMLNGICYGEARRWWGTIPNRDEKRNEEIEIDILAESEDGKRLLAAECKWTAHEDGARVLAELKQKVARLPFASNYEHIDYALFFKERPSISPDSPYYLPHQVIADKLP